MYQNRLMLVEVIASQSSVVFLRHSVGLRKKHSTYLGSNLLTAQTGTCLLKSKDARNNVIL